MSPVVTIITHQPHKPITKTKKKMNIIIAYLIANSPYTKEELIVLTVEQLKSLAYSYNMPNLNLMKVGKTYKPIIET